MVPKMPKIPKMARFLGQGYSGIFGEKTQKPLLIAMTGYGQADDRDRSKKAGFEYHLVKPVDPVKLQNLPKKASGETQFFYETTPREYHPSAEV
jgi:CheY-like chemotaxis protein